MRAYHKTAVSVHSIVQLHQFGRCVRSVISSGWLIALAVNALGSTTCLTRTLLYVNVAATVMLQPTDTAIC